MIKFYAGCKVYHPNRIRKYNQLPLIQQDRRQGLYNYHLLRGITPKFLLLVVVLLHGLGIGQRAQTIPNKLQMCW